MIACLAPQEIARYRAGELKTEEELLAMEEHLDGCAACRQNLLAAISAAAPALRERLTSPAGATTCLEPTLLARYVEGRADTTDIELVRTHCEACPRCTQDLADRIAARESAAKAAGKLAKSSASVPLWRVRLRGLFLPNGLPTRPGVAAFALVFVAALGAFAVYQGMVLPLDLRYKLLMQQQSGMTSQVTQERTSRAGLEKQLQQSDQLRKEQEIRLQQLDGRLQSLEARLSALPRATPSAASAQMLASVEQALATRRSEIAPEPQRLLALLETEQSALRGGPSDPSAPSLLQPVGTLVLEDQPTLRWKPSAGAQYYTVTLRRVADANQPDPSDEQQKAHLAGATWQVAKPLQRGKRYRWQVTTQQDGIVSSIGEFLVVDTQTAQNLRQIAQDYAGQHLTLGILYTRAGLLDAAATELAAVPQSDPKFPVAHALLQNLRAKRSPAGQSPTTSSPTP